MIKPLASMLFNQLMPLHCLLCHADVQQHPAICSHCHEQLPWLTSSCAVCSIALPEGVSGPCGECQSSKRAYTRVHALFEYAQPLDDLITRMKFGQQLGTARLLGELLLDYFREHSINLDGFAILPVPLHKLRLRERGYNQSLEIARPLAKALRLPLLTTAVQRQQPTRAQSGLSAKARVRNLKSAFSVSEKALAASVLIVDDVITTGATIDELSKTLSKAGVEKIEIATIARAS